MTLVDDQGRLFGRWNVIDALIGVVLLGLIPLLYGAYMLFRPSPSSLTLIEPSRVVANTETEFTIRGTNLRPYMRVSFGSEQGVTFLFEDATRAVVPMRGLPPGVYDVILYDNAQERGRIAKGLEVVPQERPQVQLDLIGSFTGVPEVVATQLKQGLKVDGVGELVRVGRPVPATTRTVLGSGVMLDIPSTGLFNVAAVARASCFLVPRNGVVNCAQDNVIITEDVVLRATLPAGAAMFQVDQLKTAAPEETITARVRFAGDRLAIDRMREGDRDVRRQNEFAGNATIVSLGATRQASTSIGVAVPALPGVQPFVATELAFRDAVLRVPAQHLGNRWHYAARSMDTGDVLPFNGPGYQLMATIVSVDAPVRGKP